MKREADLVGLTLTRGVSTTEKQEHADPAMRGRRYEGAGGPYIDSYFCAAKPPTVNRLRKNA